MDSSKYIMFSSAGAERFAEKYNLEMVDVSYFYTQHQYERWKGMKDSIEGAYIHYVDSVMALQKEPVALKILKKNMAPLDVWCSINMAILPPALQLAD